MKPPKSQLDSTGCMARAYELNLSAYAEALAVHGGGSIRDDGDALLTCYPYTLWSNSVVSPQLTSENVVMRIDDILKFFRMHNREVWFHVGPSSRPTNLASVLKSRGLWNFHNRPYMACDLKKLIHNQYNLAEYKITIVQDYELFRIQKHPIHGYVTTARKTHIFETYKKLDNQFPRQHWMFMVESQGAPVASTVLFLHEGVAGIHDVEVIEPHRGRGVGTTLLQHVCIFARDKGAQLAVLAASEQGVKFYPRFGFEVMGRFPTYYYSIKKQKSDAARFHESW